MTFERGYDKFNAKPLAPASVARVVALEAAVVVPDGLPPSSSPAATVQPGIGALFVRWTPVTNANPVTYAVHVAVAVPVVEGADPVVYQDLVAGPTNLVASNLVGTVTTVRALNDGTPVTADMVYAIRIIASDADGSAAAGTQAVASPAKITSPDIAAESIIGEHIAGGTITGEQLAGEIILGSKITTGGLDSAGNVVGQRVELDADGMRVISASGTPLVDMPTDPAKPNTFDGDVTARTLLVTGGTSFQSPYNEITSDSGFTLAAGISNPTGKPGLTIGYETVSLQRVARAGQAGSSLGTFSLDPTRVTSISPSSQTGIFWVVEVLAAGSRIWRYNLTTGLNVVDSGGAYVWDYPDWRITGIAALDTGQDAWIGEWAGNNRWYINRSLDTPPLNAYDARVGIGDPTLVTNGTDWYIMESRSGANLGQMIVRKIGWNTTNFGEVPKAQDITLGAGTGSTIGTQISGGRIGTMDMTGTRVAYLFQSATTDVRVADHLASANRITSLEWPSGIASTQRGFMWHPPTTAWYSLDSAGVLIKYTSQTLTGGTHWHLATSIYDSNAAGTGTHETLVGPKATVAMRKRALLRVSIPTVPVAGGGVDDPDKYRLYAAQNSSTVPPASTSFRFQSEGTTPTTGPGSATLTTIATATAAPPTVNNFPAATPAYIRSIAADGGGDPLWRHEGNGDARMGPIEVLGSSPTILRGNDGGPLLGTYLAVSADTTSISSAQSSPYTAIGSWANAGGSQLYTTYSLGNWTMLYGGSYMLEVSVSFGAGTDAGRGGIILFKNGSEYRRHLPRFASTATVGHTFFVTVAAGDVLSPKAYQNSGGAVSLAGSTGHHFNLTRLSQTVN